MPAVAVIGGSKGIGKAVVTGLLDRGVDVVSFARSPLEPQAANHAHHEVDILRDDIGEHIPDALLGLVYAPGSMNLSPIGRLNRQQLMDDIDINVVGAMNAVQAALPALKNSPGSGIVFFSTVAVQTGMPFHASVAAAKGAVEGFARSLAAELAPTVRVNTVAPSLTDTPLAERLLSNEKRRDESAGRHPLRSVGSPEQIASAAISLLIDQTWTTGIVLPVDGGIGSLSIPTR